MNTNPAWDEFPVCLKLRIDWSELDYFGHVNNVSFFKYIQSSRVYYWDQIGLTVYHKETGLGPMLASCQCTFKAPLYYPGEIRIFSRLAFIRNTSFSIEHIIVDAEGNTAAEAQDIMVMYDFHKNQKTPFPDFLRKSIEKLEGRTFPAQE